MCVCLCLSLERIKRNAITIEDSFFFCFPSNKNSSSSWFRSLCIRSLVGRTQQLSTSPSLRHALGVRSASNHHGRNLCLSFPFQRILEFRHDRNTRSCIRTERRRNTKWDDSTQWPDKRRPLAFLLQKPPGQTNPVENNIIHHAFLAWSFRILAFRSFRAKKKNIQSVRIQIGCFIFIFWLYFFFHIRKRKNQNRVCELNNFLVWI